MENSEKIKESISYLLYVLYAQKYGDSDEKESRLLQYYNLIGYHDQIGKEILRENKDTYDTVTDDQLKYLLLSRSMLKNLQLNMPNIDLNQIKLRADEMAKNDPYRIRKKMVVKSTVSCKKNITDIFFNEPDIAIQAGSTAMAQLGIDDDIKDEVRNNMVNKWEFDDEAYESIMSISEGIRKESDKQE